MMGPRSWQIGQFLFLGLLITGLSLYSLPPVGPEAGGDKVLHLLAYLGLLLSLDLACCPRQRLPGKILGLFAYSFLLEIAQYFTPDRHFSLGDLAANLAGLLLGAAIAAILGRFRAGRSRAL